MDDNLIVSIDIQPEPPQVKMPFWQFLIFNSFALLIGLYAGSYLATF